MSSNERGESQEIAQVSGKAPCSRAFFREPLAHDSSLFLATLRLILYCLGSLIAFIGCLRLFRLHGVTTFSFILRLNSKVAFQSPWFLFFVFWGVERRRHCFCSMITWKFNSSAQLNVVTKSLLMSCKGRCKLQVEIFIFLTSPRLIRILALSRVRSRQREIT